MKSEETLAEKLSLTSMLVLQRSESWATMTASEKAAVQQAINDVGVMMQQAINDVGAKALAKIREL